MYTCTCTSIYIHVFQKHGKHKDRLPKVEREQLIKRLNKEQIGEKIKAGFTKAESEILQSVISCYRFLCSFCFFIASSYSFCKWTGRFLCYWWWELNFPVNEIASMSLIKYQMLCCWQEIKSRLAAAGTRAVVAELNFRTHVDVCKVLRRLSPAVPVCVYNDSESPRIICFCPNGQVR